MPSHMYGGGKLQSVRGGNETSNLNDTNDISAQKKYKL